MFVTVKFKLIIYNHAHGCGYDINGDAYKLESLIFSHGKAVVLDGGKGLDKGHIKENIKRREYKAKVSVDARYEHNRNVDGYYQNLKQHGHCKGLSAAAVHFCFLFDDRVAVFIVFHGNHPLRCNITQPHKKINPEVYMSFKKLSNRLALAAEFTTDGKIIADIGTDHGSLPIFLVGSGKCPSAVAADLRKGPLESAKSNIEAAGLSDKIVTRLSDGLCGIGPDEFDEAVMAGMGGILICGILENCPYRNDKAFVLQPMSDPDTVRSWLYANGFDITKEKAVCEGKRVYVVMRAEYCGKSHSPTDFEALVGTLAQSPSAAEFEYFKKLSRTLDRQIKGQNQAGEDTSSVKELKRQIDSLLR